MIQVFKLEKQNLGEPIRYYFIKNSFVIQYIYYYQSIKKSTHDRFNISKKIKFNFIELFFNIYRFTIILLLVYNQLIFIETALI
ncbi:unnamed protein product [Rotaria sordida]|uniref:Transmembrane protein n=2 Tax=Rotaria sordida TaxID=392033 RepID=A0A814QC32_9BILA|nr:unnamed protein product [Rotaria sordida]